MAIVTNLARPTEPLDQPFTTPLRSGVAPNGVVTPLYAGEPYLDTTTHVTWVAENLSNASWIQRTPIIF
jgi:hypothetical protein